MSALPPIADRGRLDFCEAQHIVLAYSSKERKGFVMVGGPETVAVLREILDDAWARLRPVQQATMLKSTLAERILKSAAKGERDRERLIDAALEDDLAT